MAGFLDALFGGGSGPTPAISQPLIKALLAKHGAALPEVPTAGAAVADVADGPKVGSDLSPDGRMTNVFDAMPSAELPGVLGADGGSPIKDAFAANAAKPRGFLDRIGDFLHSDEGRATAMRFAAGAFKGGIGGGLDAATDFADHRRHERAVTAAADADRAERGREFDETSKFHLGQLDLTRDMNHETAEHYRRGDMNDYRRIQAELHKHDTASGDARLSSSTSILNHLRPSGDTIVNARERQFEHTTPSGDVTTQQAGENYRARLPKPGDPGYAETVEETDGTPFKDGWFSDTPATPKVTKTTRTPIRPSEVQPAGGGQGQPEVRFDASGQAFVQGPDGSAVRAPQYDRR